MGASVSQDPESRRSGVEHYVHQEKEAAQTELPGLGPMNLTPGPNQAPTAPRPVGVCRLVGPVQLLETS